MANGGGEGSEPADSPTELYMKCNKIGTDILQASLIMINSAYNLWSVCSEEHLRQAGHQQRHAEPHSQARRGRQVVYIETACFSKRDKKGEINVQLMYCTTVCLYLYTCLKEIFLDKINKGQLYVCVRERERGEREIERDRDRGEGVRYHQQHYLSERYIRK
jgi:hypothetical protein